MSSHSVHKEDLPAAPVGPLTPGRRSWPLIELSPPTRWAQTTPAPVCSPAARRGWCSRCRTLWGTDHIILTHCRGPGNTVMDAFLLSYLLLPSLLLVKHFTSKAEMALAALGISEKVVLSCHLNRFLLSLISNTWAASHQALSTSSTPQQLNAYCTENIGSVYLTCVADKKATKVEFSSQSLLVYLIPRSSGATLVFSTSRKHGYYWSAACHACKTSH